MNSPWKQLHPQDSFSVKLATPMTELDERLLSYLYQPIIGIDAFSIFHALLTAVDKWAMDSQETLHSDLFNQLSIDLPRLFNGRLRLEGIGLLQVHVREINQRREFIYELCPPLGAEAFFKDDVLSLLLLDKVGERRFGNLVKQFAPTPINLENYTTVTKKFLDVYQFNQESLAGHQELLSQTKAQFKTTESSPLSSVSPTFDWPYFTSLLEGLYIDKEQVEGELKETIYTLHQLYGLNELEMKGLVEAEVDFTTNKVAINQLRKTIVLKYHSQKKQEPAKKDEEAKDLSLSDQATRRHNTLKLQGYTEGDIQVIHSAETISPMIFFSAIKNQKGGFVANEERWVIENLVKQSGLPDAVINVLIHYVLVVKGNPSLNQKFVNPIANDWAQSQIYSPEEAITKVKELAAPKASSKPNYSNNKGNRKYSSTRKESLPEWVGQEKAETSVSAEEEAFFKEQLRQLRNPGKEGDS